MGFSPSRGLTFFPYRDQLDQMVTGAPTKKATPEIPQQQYQQQYQPQYQSQQQHEFDPVREKRDLEQRYMQANVEEQQRKERSYPESKVLDNAPYYGGSNDYGRYPAPQNDYPQVSSGTYARRGESPVQTQTQVIFTVKNCLLNLNNNRVEDKPKEKLLVVEMNPEALLINKMN